MAMKAMAEQKNYQFYAINFTNVTLIIHVRPLRDGELRKEVPYLICFEPGYRISKGPGPIVYLLGFVTVKLISFYLYIVLVRYYL